MLLFFFLLALVLEQHDFRKSCKMPRGFGLARALFMLYMTVRISNAFVF